MDVMMMRVHGHHTETRAYSHRRMRIHRAVTAAMNLNWRARAAVIGRAVRPVTPGGPGCVAYGDVWPPLTQER